MKYFITTISLIFFLKFNTIFAQNDTINSSNSSQSQFDQNIKIADLDSIVRIKQYSNLSIGKPYQGGIIFYILQPDNIGYIENEVHGLIAATADQSKRLPWWNGIYINSGASATGIGEGLANTNAIIKTQGNVGFYAAKICREYNGGGYSDWYLPTWFELEKMFEASSFLEISSGFYWSSTEINFEEVWRIGSIDESSAHSDNDYKNNTYHVRAIRAF